MSTFECPNVLCNHGNMAKPLSVREAEFLSIQEQYGSLIRKAIRKIYPSFSESDMQDVEQEIHIKLWKLLETQNVQYPATYLYKVAATTAIDMLRKIKPGKQEPITDAHGMQTTERGKLSEALNSSLKRLAESRREAVQLYLQGYNPEEIGQLMAWSTARARNLVYRGLEDLRKLLKQEGIHYESE